MKALAEYIMRGRMQAASIVVLGYIVPLLTPLTVALVTLRRGANEGTLMVLIGLLPALASLFLSDSSTLVVWITLTSLLSVLVPSIVLRGAVSLPLAVISAIAISVAISLVAMNFASEQVDELVLLMFGSFAEQEGTKTLLETMVTNTAVAGMISYILALNGLSGLLLGRWLQARLYNPGGFGDEYRELRLGVGIACLCFVGSVFFRFQGSEYWWWSNVFSLPLLMVVIAIAHSWVKQKQLSAAWLVLCYLVVFILGPLIMTIGFLDTWLNFRSRLQKK